MNLHLHPRQQQQQQQQQEQQLAPSDPALRHGHGSLLLLPRKPPENKSAVPLSYLLSRDLHSQKLPRPLLRYGHCSQAKKGEDRVLVRTECQRIPGDSSSGFSVFAILDGHNGVAAATYAKENLLKDVMGALPPNLSREEWLSILPKALVSGFVKTDKEFCETEQRSGTTATLVVVDGWTITVACVGDSRCIMDSQGGTISTLTIDHRLEENVEERGRVAASGGQVRRLCLADGVEIGPLRCWPGGLCLSRSIGDVDAGEFIVPIPHVKQVKLSNAGGRLIIASDGVWDALSSERAAKCSRGLPAELAAKQIVKESLKARGLLDDTTCLVVDIMPPKLPVPVPAVPKKQSKIKSFLFGKKVVGQESVNRAPIKPIEVNSGLIEELFEQGSIFMTDRLGMDISTSGTAGLFHCAVCRTDITPRERISVHAGSFFSMNDKKPWEAPFLCLKCKLTKDDMDSEKAKML